jgi:hypothetical protein
VSAEDRRVTAREDEPLPSWRAAPGDTAGSFEGGPHGSVPAGTAHRFRCLGSVRLRLVSIHPAPLMETTWLDERR